MADKTLKALFSAGVVSSLDFHFARLMDGLNGSRCSTLPLAAAMVSSYTRQGHICIGLRRIGGAPLAGAPEAGAFPVADTWCTELSRTDVVGKPGDYKPLILDGSGRLYLYRYWEYQRNLCDNLKERMGRASPISADMMVQLDRLFPTKGEIDWQKIAAFSGATKMFCVISGGPGTGKTTTVARILALLTAGAGPVKLRVALATPTGKAATRLQEAIKEAKGKLAEDGHDIDSIPESASTIHRLLGTVRGTPYFLHNEENPLSVDALVIDEASMVDLALMSKLVQALPPNARLILLGDKDQLASVEAGAVLGDICDTGGPIRYTPDFAGSCEKICGAALQGSFILNGKCRKPADSLIELQKSYRFKEASGIALLSSAVRDKDELKALSILKSGAYPDLAWNEIPRGRQLGPSLKQEIIDGFKEYLSEVKALQRRGSGGPDGSLNRVFESFGKFRILCALREGPFGVSTLNELVELFLEDARLLDRRGKWYAGKPVLVCRNDYSLRLFNGDVGLFLPDAHSGGDFRVIFQGAGGKFRSFHPMRLPEHETVYAMTVHKSQGSEFDNVLLVLPDRDSPILTRELVYTGITRARKRISVRGCETVLRTAITRSAERLSGLSEALWGE